MNPTMSAMERRLFVVATAGSIPVTPEARVKPRRATIPPRNPWTPSGSQRCHGRKTSAMRTAATRTMASTTQLMTVP